jgi:hypothetical protein
VDNIHTNKCVMFIVSEGGLFLPHFLRPAVDNLWITIVIHLTLKSVRLSE